MSDTTEPNPAKVVPQSGRSFKKGLPAVGIATVEDNVRELWAMARHGTTTLDAFASQIGHKSASGGAWNVRIALLRGFNLVQEAGDRIGLSALGKQIVNDSDPIAQSAARRQAVMNLRAYRDLVHAFDGTQLPDAVSLAKRLKFEYGKTDSFAERAARAFLDTLSLAEMIDSNNAVWKEGVSEDSVTSVEYSTEGSEQERYDAEIDRAFDGQEEGEGEGEQPDISWRVTGKFGSLGNVSLSITLDLSQYRADEVVKILRAIGLAGSG